jgi:phenylacetate-coenzyme A ligase PaaK-like adenylate-forming protein
VFDPWATAVAYGDALAVGAGPAAAWQARRDARIAQLLGHTLPLSPLYRTRWTDRPALPPLERLARVPRLGRRELMAHFADWLTDPALDVGALRAFVADPSRRGQAFAGRWLVWESSGSSGEPGLFVQDAGSLAVADALEAARGPLAPSWLLGPAGVFGLEHLPADARIAFVGATDGPYAAVASFERLRALNPWLRTRLASFSFMQAPHVLARQLEAFAPQVLASYPSMAWVLAQQQAAGRLRLALRAVCTGGETLTPALRQRIGAVFGVPVRDSYGASECLLIASECRAGGLHLHADWVVLEPVDDAGRAVPPGEAGHGALLTHLGARLQPIVRYALGDRVRFVPGACRCGSALPLIEVQGRADDVLALADAKGRLVHLAPLALTTVLEEEGGVFDFELRARGPRSLALELFDAAAPAVRAAAALRAFLQRQGLAGVRVVVHHRPAPPRGRSGKRRRVFAAPAEETR